MGESIDLFGEAAVFSTIGGNSVSWKVERDESSLDKILIKLFREFYVFIRMS